MHASLQDMDERHLRSFYALMAAQGEQFNSPDAAVRDGLAAKVDAYVRQHCGVSHEQFITDANPATLNTGVYKLFTDPEIKEECFRARSIVLFGAFADSNPADYTPCEMLQALQHIRQIPIIGDQDAPGEATAAYILKHLAKNHAT